MRGIDAGNEKCAYTCNGRLIFKMAKETKTNAMRLLDRAGIHYVTHTYDTSDGKIDGLSVAAKLGREANRVFKTLVTKGKSGGYYIFVLPVEGELDLKKAAAAVGEKSVEMLPVTDLLKATGYVRGGCSPVGMKKQYPTVFDVSVLNGGPVIISGGRIGCQIEAAPGDLLKLTYGKTAVLLSG